MKAICILAAISVIITPAIARSWVDTKGRVVDGTVAALTGSTVMLRLQGGRLLEVTRSKLSPSDQALLSRFDLHKRTANRLRIEIIQSTGAGAFGRIYRLRTIAVRKNVPTHYSSLDGRWATEQQTVNEDVTELVHDKAYVEGLSPVAEGETVDFIGWTAGSKNYETVMGAAVSVPKYRLDPPEGAVAIEAGDFGK